MNAHKIDKPLKTANAQFVPFVECPHCCHRQECDVDDMAGAWESKRFCDWCDQQFQIDYED